MKIRIYSAPEGFAVLWEKLGDDEKRQFRRHIDGLLPIDRANEIIPVTEAAKILHVTFYKAKRLIAEANIQPVPEPVMQGPFAFLFRPTTPKPPRYRRSDIEALAKRLKK